MIKLSVKYNISVGFIWIMAEKDKRHSAKSAKNEE